MIGMYSRKASRAEDRVEELVKELKKLEKKLVDRPSPPHNNSQIQQTIETTKDIIITVLKNKYK